MRKRLLMFLAVMMTCGCGRTQSAVITNSASLNSSKADMSGYQYLNDDSHAFLEISMAESLKMFSDAGSGIIYFGKEDCRWCQLAVPELNTAAKTMGVSVYYVDVTDAENDSSYADLKTAISSTFKTNTSAQKAFMIPLVISVKKGTIVDSHLSLVDDFNPEDDSAVMDDTQKMELQNVYKELIREAAD